MNETRSSFYIAIIHAGQGHTCTLQLYDTKKHFFYHHSLVKGEMDFFCLAMIQWGNILIPSNFLQNDMHID